MNNNFNKKYRLILSDDRKLYTIIERLKHKYDYTPFIKSNLIKLFKEAKKLGIKKAVFIAKKQPKDYERALLVYKTRPLIVKDTNAPNPFKKFKISTIYLLLPDEEPPKDVDISPNSTCVVNEETLDLTNEKETGKKVTEILKKLISEMFPFKDIPVPEMPPTEDYFYLLPKPEKGKLSVVKPLKLLQNFPADRSYNNNNWHATVDGNMVAEPISPHDPCYYEILCCNAPPKDSLYKQQNFIRIRRFDFFNFSHSGILLPLAFYTSSKVISSLLSPPVVPPGVNYPKKKYVVPKYRIPVPERPSAPSGAGRPGLLIKPLTLAGGRRNKPATSGGRPLRRSGSSNLSGRQIPNSGSTTNTGIPPTITSFKINVGIKKNQRKIVSGKGSRRADTQSFKRNAWYNSRGILRNGSFLRVKDSVPFPRVSLEDNEGLIPTTDIPDDIRINAGANKIGIGYSTVRIEQFKDNIPNLSGYGYYFTQSTFTPAQDPDFGNVATEVYQDNIFFFPYDLPFPTPELSYYDFFVKFKGYSKTNTGSVVPAVYWNTKAPFPVTLEGACSAVFNNKLYVIGGWDGLAYQNTVWEYDPITDNWTAKLNMPTARSEACCGVVGDKIYVFGGFNGGLLNTTEEYDVTNNLWNPKANMLASVTRACCGVVGTDCYVFGGNIGVISLDTFEYDSVGNAWNPKAAMGVARENLFCSVVAGKVYVMGGNNLLGELDTNEEYDPVGDVFLLKAIITIPLEGAVADTLLGIIYVFGGNSLGMPVPFTEGYDPVGDAWLPQPAVIPTLRYNLTGNFILGKFYAVSGNLGGPLTDVNEEYDPNALPSTGDMSTQEMFNLFGRKNGQDVFQDTFSVANSQSVAVVDNADVVIFELKADYTPTSDIQGDLTITLKAFKADNSVTYGTLTHTFNNITDIVDDQAIHVRIGVQQSNLGQVGGQVILNPVIELPSQTQDMGNLTVNVNADIDLIDKLAFGYIDYLYSNSDPVQLTNKDSDYSGAGILTGLVITSEPINRNYIWDYTRN